ncbi:hypothetical protein [uncultured Bacteroides sp.]|uniref:hypothetical protein n=1 Tax=uncultured Bacteroides sp. TaxID=162156 RepID=UPI00266F09D8|nr:hypothetical protein [uncultured Bacteroides sp.]
MKDSLLSKELIEAFRPIAEMNNARFRQAKTMLAGFISTQERDLNYMDEYMDVLFDFMDSESDIEMLMRQYYDYIATFDAKEARRRIDSLENDMGYMTKIVYAAGLVAQKLHKGQTDKGGNDYFESHLLKVADAGFDWKEKVVGFLHDASEDCNVMVEDVMNLLDQEISRVVDNPKEHWHEEDWWEDWMEDIAVYPCTVTHVITTEERDEIKTALTLLNHNTVPSREEYINRISSNLLALKVKLNDLRNNMDITRIPEPIEKDYARIERYKKEHDILMEALRNRLNI